MRHLILFTRFGRRDKFLLYGLWSLLPLSTCVVATLDSTSKTLKKTKHKNRKKDQWLEPSQRRQKGEAKSKQATGTKKKGES
jgi:hypothetical protein